jgi:hypothetical protein
MLSPILGITNSTLAMIVPALATPPQKYDKLISKLNRGGQNINGERKNTHVFATVRGRILTIRAMPTNRWAILRKFAPNRVS